ncbi:MAG: hypothetical protein K2Q07_03935 [Burkholderiaceae bacterium]|nr:hypothetical protein [Burkholderiaceae bacterium]
MPGQAAIKARIDRDVLVLHALGGQQYDERCARICSASDSSSGGPQVEPVEAHEIPSR